MGHRRFRHLDEVPRYGLILQKKKKLSRPADKGEENGREQTLSASAQELEARLETRLSCNDKG